MIANQVRPALLLFATILFGCAQVVDITGGPADTIPPELVAADPPHLSTDFTGRRITLVFNERIQLDRVRERLLVSPPLGVPPTVRLAGQRSVVIDLNEPLLPNTTYSFGIGEAVKDLTEGNPATGVTHVISTGPYVDSLVIAGEVINAFSGTPEKEMLVMVYHVDDTATIRTGRPAYATRSNEKGRFQLEHLRSGEYHLYALRDQNANYRFDLPNEEVAFLGPPVRPEVPDTLVRRHRLRAFREPAAVQQIREAKVLADGPFRILLERPADSIAITDIARVGGRLEWLPEWNATRDTILLWPGDTTALDAGRYQVATEDGILDTLRYRRLEKMPFFTTVQARLVEQEDEPEILIRTSRPIATHDPARFEVLRDSLPLSVQYRRIPNDPRGMIMTAPIEPGMNVTLRLMPGAITDIYGGRNDTLITGLGRAAEQNTGTLRIRMEMFEDAKGPFLLQLLDRQGVVARQSVLDVIESELVWERVMPGQYGLRLIEDRNENERWDPGILDEGLQPEMVWRHPETVNVRASWDLGVDWVIGVRPITEDDEDEGDEP
jgi:hypothetical protein